MTREQRIVETFVELADTMGEEFDVVDFLHRLTGRCLALLDCAEVGVMLMDGAGALRVIACSNERTEALELLQSQNDEGPCLECYHREQPVRSEDLGIDAGRWPVFAPAALHKGFRSVQALPMRTREQTIGALNLFRSDPGRMRESDLSLAGGLADVATIGLLQERSIRESRVVVGQLEVALHSRVAIEQAKGLLAEHSQISVDDAFACLRGYARHHNRRLSDVARELLDGQLDGASVSQLAPHR